MRGVDRQHTGKWEVEPGTDPGVSADNEGLVFKEAEPGSNHPKAGSWTLPGGDKATGRLNFRPLRKSPFG